MSSTIAVVSLTAAGGSNTCVVDSSNSSVISSTGVSLSNLTESYQRSAKIIMYNRDIIGYHDRVISVIIRVNIMRAISIRGVSIRVIRVIRVTSRVRRTKAASLSAQ